MMRKNYRRTAILISIVIGSLIGSSILTRSISARSDQDRIDLAISGGSLVTMDKDYRVIEDGYVAIRGDRIVDLGARSDLEKKYSAKTVIDAKGKAVLPGLINTH